MMKPVHLVMVTANNNNKFYDMIPQGNQFLVRYGRINATCTELVKPISEWNKLYLSKIKKGYVDKSDLVADAVVKRDLVTIADRDIADLIDQLQSYANKTIAQNYDIAVGQVTAKMISEAKRVLALLANTDSIAEFNNRLLELFSIIPRKMKKVQAFLAVDKNDFGRILSNEHDLLEVMKTQVSINKPIDNNTKINILDALGISIAKKDFALEREVLDMLGELKDKFVNCWYVENIATAARYNNRLAKQKGIHITEQKFWHGSRNENWFSILQNGMMIRPSGVVITGAMFGNGIYFADKARKSYGYTSANGSYWANGKSDKAYMALFKVNTGKYHNVYSHNDDCYKFNESYLRNKGNFDSVFAHRGADLVNNEYIVYNVDQCTIYALVELKG